MWAVLRTKWLIGIVVREVPLVLFQDCVLFSFRSYGRGFYISATFLVTAEPVINESTVSFGIYSISSRLYTLCLDQENQKKLKKTVPQMREA